MINTKNDSGKYSLCMYVCMYVCMYIYISPAEALHIDVLLGEQFESRFQIFDLFHVRCDLRSVLRVAARMGHRTYHTYIHT